MNVPPRKTRFLKATQTQYEAVCDMFLPKLSADLPAYLYYHNADHVKGVIRDTEYLIAKENVPGEDRWMILTAALFHDSGFLQVYNDHESRSCELAQEILPAYNFSRECIDAICQMIRATHLPQTPADPYGEILCDADLFYFGTDDFFDTAERLFRELKGLGFVHDREEWNEKQLAFLQTHRYFTKTAKAELEPEKQKLITRLQKEKA